MRYSLQLVQMRALGIETVSEIKTYRPLSRRSDTLRRREDSVCVEISESQKNDSAQTGLMPDTTTADIIAVPDRGFRI